MLPGECQQVGDTCVVHNAEWSTRNGDDLGHCEWIEARTEIVPEWRSAERALRAALATPAASSEPHLTHGRHCPCSACAREDWTNCPVHTFVRAENCDNPACRERRTLAAASPGDNAWLDRLVKAERENHCGDAACMTRRVSAAVRVLTGGKEHQDYCWAVETFEVELGVRDPALVGAEPSNAMLDDALAAASQGDEGLDVERLAKAWHVGICGAASPDAMVYGHDWREHDEAHDLAREYAALDAEEER